jgi:hypothetical protein
VNTPLKVLLRERHPLHSSPHRPLEQRLDALIVITNGSLRANAVVILELGREQNVQRPAASHLVPLLPCALHPKTSARSTTQTRIGPFCLPRRKTLIFGCHGQQNLLLKWWPKPIPKRRVTIGKLRQGSYNPPARGGNRVGHHCHSIV